MTVISIFLSVLGVLALGICLGVVCTLIDRKLDGTHGRRYYGPGYGDD